MVDFSHSRPNVHRILSVPSLMLLALLATATNCGQEPPRVLHAAPLMSFDSLFRKVGDLTLAESADVINVAPNVYPDDRGGYLIADQQEAQIRHYAADGQLLAHFGRKGRGPGEFTYPTVVVREPDNNILVLEMESRGTLLNSRADSVLWVRNLAIQRVEDGAALDDSHFLLSGTHNATESPRIHVWNISTGNIESSFFSPFQKLANPMAGSIADWTKFDVRHGTIAVVFSIIDTVYYYTTKGKLVGQAAIPYAGFRHPGPIPSEARRNNRARAEWASSFDMVSEVFWVTDDILVVQVQRWENFVPTYTLVVMTRDGDGVGMTTGTPRLLTVSEFGDTIITVQPGSDTPNKWRLSRLRMQ